MNTEQTSERGELERRARRHAALGEPSRLAVADLLALGDLSVAELRAALTMPSNLLAHHLNVLEKALELTKAGSAGTKSELEDRFLALTCKSGMPEPVVTPRSKTSSSTSTSSPN